MTNVDGNVRRLRGAGLVAGLALLSGCAVTQSELDQRMTEMHSYVDQKTAEVRAASETALKAVQAQEQETRQNREALRAMLEAQSQALDQEKRAIDALLDRLKAASPAAPSSTQSAPKVK